ncbi:MAG TPA: hypothetical protein VNX46_00910 [Candidatus Acidoferrum sp.]|jgi:hypothetical protein|nr:hypothetical protein [Candidatus Acidoferrum sp.]
MKALHIFINPWRIINHFGNALLVQRFDGKHELLGGSDGDYTAAKEWVSLFAHEIVFTRSVKRRRQRGF